MDIEKHEWQNHDYPVSIDSDGEVEFIIRGNYLTISKSDAIAIAKHFNILDDLKIIEMREAVGLPKKDFNTVCTSTDILLSGANGQRIRESIKQIEGTEYD